MIEYRTSTAGLRPEQLQGFFAGWPHPPTAEMHLRLLDGSTEVVLAVENDSSEVVGLVNALSDGVLADSAFAWLPIWFPTTLDSIPTG